ncbi:MAG: lysophospholipase, partial [Cyanobacteria bacterium]|nr:lysophospholipase [Cyanobacteriota bacterium]
RGHLNSFRDFVSDVTTFLSAVRAEHPTQPLILWGNCWGAKAASLLACQSKKLGLNGVIFSSPAIETLVDLDLTTKISIAGELIAGTPCRRKWPIPLTLSMFTDSPVYLRFLKADPLRITQATTSFYLESQKLSELAKRTARKIKCPVLVLQAGDDRIVDVLALERWYSRIAASDKSLRIFPLAAHSLDFDQNWFDEYAQMACNWILSHSRERS